MLRHSPQPFPMLTSCFSTGMMTLSADVALDKVTEEVVETAVYSAAVSAARDPTTIANSKVAVILEIDRSTAVDWRCYVAVGAWKRVCINLVSNALKYTAAGHIRITLKAKPIPDKRKKFNVTFSVSDTGRGMSEDFLENHLFRVCLYLFTQALLTNFLDCRLFNKKTRS